MVLLRSPRAGYGKTFLLKELRRSVGEGMRFLAVEPSCGGRVDGEVVLDSVLRQLSVVLPASGGLTELDFFGRRLFAYGLKPLLVSGEIPSHDREGALFAIENRPIETFDFHHQQAATAHWTQSNFEVLGPRLASELSEASGCPLRECAYWIDIIFRYVTTSPERVERSRQFAEAVLSELNGQAASAVEERLQGLLSLLCLVEPTALIFDETEGLSNQPESALRVAAFLVQIRQACPRLTVLLSVNDDVWQTGFEALMPGGLRDRLTEHVVELKELSREEGEALLQDRFGAEAMEVSSQVDWSQPVYARELLKIGRRVLDAAEGGMEASVVASSVAPPAYPDLLESPAVTPILEKEEPVLFADAQGETGEMLGIEVESEDVIPSEAVGVVDPVGDSPFSFAEESAAQSETLDPFEASEEVKDVVPPALPDIAASEQNVEKGEEPPVESSPFSVVSEGLPAAETVEDSPFRTTGAVVPAGDPFAAISQERTDAVGQDSVESGDSPFRLPEQEGVEERGGEVGDHPFQVSTTERGESVWSQDTPPQIPEPPNMPEQATKEVEGSPFSLPSEPEPVVAETRAESSPFSLASSESRGDLPSREAEPESGLAAAPLAPESPFSAFVSEEPQLASGPKSAETAVGKEEGPSETEPMQAFQAGGPSEQLTPASSPAALEADSPFRAPVEAPETPSPKILEEPAQTPLEARAVAETSPFSAAPAAAGGEVEPDLSRDESAKVEELLSQFKQRFGQGE
ncbi:MAG: hypothetical protein AAGC74_05070 [Verrucomicrobiota bacterium]